MTTFARRRLAGAGALVIWLYLLQAVLTVSTAAAADPQYVGGNPSCGDVTNGGTEFKIQKGAELQAGDSGMYSDGTLEVTLTIYETGNGWEFDWATNFGVDSVVVKGGPGANVYLYNPPATSDTGLHAPLNNSNQRWYGLSHISFCYLEDNSTSTSSSTSSSSSSTSSTSSSTTSSSTSSTSSSTSSTSSSTTSTTGGTTPPGETTTTVSVQGTVVTSTTAPEAAVPTIAGTVVTTAAAIAVDTLPFTGAEAQDLVVLAIGVLLIGALLIASVRRPETEAGRHARPWSDHRER